MLAYDNSSGGGQPHYPTIVLRIFAFYFIYITHATLLAAAEATHTHVASTERAVLALRGAPNLCERQIGEKVAAHRHHRIFNDSSHFGDSSQFSFSRSGSWGEWDAKRSIGNGISCRFSHMAAVPTHGNFGDGGGGGRKKSLTLKS